MLSRVGRVRPRATAARADMAGQGCVAESLRGIKQNGASGATLVRGKRRRLAAVSFRCERDASAWDEKAADAEQCGLGRNARDAWRPAASRFATEETVTRGVRWHWDQSSVSLVSRFAVREILSHDMRTRQEQGGRVCGVRSAGRAAREEGRRKFLTQIQRDARRCTQMDRVGCGDVPRSR
jgi:hypothetical protein